MRRNFSVSWVSYCYFLFEEKLVKRFVPCYAFMESSSLKRGLIGSETSVRNYHYLLRYNPEERISEGSTVLSNTRRYRPNDITSKNTGVFSVTTGRTKPLVFYSYIHYLICLMMLFIAKFNIELECGRKSF